MGRLWQDIRYGLRMLARNPGFTAVVVIVLGLGIGANTAIFSIVNGVLLRPLPFQDPGRVVQILTQRKGDWEDPLNSMQDCLDIQKRSHVFEGAAPISLQLILDAGGDEPRYLGGAHVPARFFDLLGVQPVLGRGFRPEEERLGQDRVVVLSHQYWTQRHGADSDIIGQNVVLQEGVWARGGMVFTAGTYTVIGVMPAGFWCLDQRELWMPLVLNAEGSGKSGSNQGAYLIGRLRPEIRREQAQAEIDVIGNQLVQERPQAGKDRRLLLVSPRDRLVSNVRPTLCILMGTVGFVLLIACANVANMTLARSLGRRREMAIRAALGAGRLRLIRQFFTESFLLSLLGGLSGLSVTVSSFGLIKSVLPSDMPRVSEIQIDGWVFGFALLVSILTGALMGLAPILRIGGIDAGRNLKEGGLTVHGGTCRSALHRGLLVSEVALSLMLLIGAGLMIRSLRRLTSTDLGFDPTNALVADVDSAGSIHPQQEVYLQVLMDRIRRLPGVQTVALGDLSLFGSRSQNSFGIPGRDISPDEERPSADVIHIDEGYFLTLRIPLLQGRSVAENDRANTEAVVVVNQAFARRYFPDASVVGRVITCWDREWRIVGAVDDVCPGGFRSEATPTMYFPYRQVARPLVRLIVRTVGEPFSALKPIRQELLALSPGRPAAQIRTIDELLGRQTAALCLSTRLFGLFAVLALTLVAVGVYGLMAFFVSQRTQEIGIRMALGARSTDVLRSVVGQGLKLALIGTGIGLAGAFALTRVIRRLLYDISPADPLTFALVSLLLIAVALLACYIPARRAARIDPMAALRYE